MTQDAQRDHDVDFLVVGSGAGGMVAALTAAREGLKPLIVEKASTFGGSSAISGGGIWVPNNPTLRRAGIVDSPESVKRYLEIITEGRVPPARIESYVTNGPPMMEFLETSQHLRFHWVKGYSDYHPEAEGGRPEGRSVEANSIDTRKLGAAEADLHPNGRSLTGLWYSTNDAHQTAMAKRTWRGRRAALIATWRVKSNVIRRRHMAALGRALVARLWLALRDADVPIWLDAPMTELISDGRSVQGAVVMREGQPVRIRSRHGVLIAAGGFDHNPEMRTGYLPSGGHADFSLGAVENTGDGIRAGAGVGADLGLMDDAWWMPTTAGPAGNVMLVAERGIPSQIIVNQHGQRFTNEAGPYVNFVHDQFAGGFSPLWLIMDSRARKGYPFAKTPAGREFPRGHYDRGIVHRAPALDALARSVGVPPESLIATVDRYNRFARAGVDEDFGRGNSAYDHYWGDPTMKNPALDQIIKPPFYAIRVEIGDLGTKGGLVCDELSRVLRPDGSVIEGLYATGNSSASVMGNDYSGAGATLGPSMVFGFVAAKHASSQHDDRTAPVSPG
jgi:3-oxosteroid 1-dehydrogenase